MEIDTVLFDLDDTLFDHAASARAGVARFLRGHGVEAETSLIDAWIEIEQVEYARWVNGEVSFQEQRRERLRRFLPLVGLATPANDAALDRRFSLYLTAYEHSWVVFDDAEQALTQLLDAGIMTGVITNGNQEQQKAKIRKIGLEPLLRRVFTSERLGCSKPLPEAFLLPCISLGTAPTNVLYVGDNYRIDVEGAKAAGLHSVHLNRNPQREPADTGTVKSLLELEDFIAQQGRHAGAAPNRK